MKASTPSRIEKSRAEIQKHKSDIQRADKDLGKRVERYKRNGVGAIKIDFCFVMDCTRSMGSYIAAAKENVYAIQREVQLRFGTRSTLRYAFVGYRDYEDRVPFEIFKFSENVGDFKNFIACLDADGGGDLPEDLTGALHTALNLNWRHTVRVCIIIADAPCHGKQYHPSYIRDDHPDGDVNKRDPCNIVEKMRKKDLNLHFFKINASTDVMLEKLKKAYDRGFGRTAYKLHQHKLGDSLRLFLDLAITSISSSVSASMLRGEATISKSSSLAIKSWSNTKRDFRPRLDRVIAQKLSGLPALQEEPMKLASCANDSWGPLEDADVYTATSEGKPVANVIVQMEPEPFASGAMRCAFWLRVKQSSGLPLKAGEVMVLKESKLSGTENNSKQTMILDLESQIQAKKLADQWNQEVVSRGIGVRIDFLPAYVLNFKKRRSLDRQWMSVEPALPNPDSFRKYNNNAGFVEPSEEAEIPNAFTHWTWHVTNIQLCVMDMQGARQSSGTFLLTDPQVQCKDQNRFGKGNLGQKGIARFFAAHDCGDICMKLALRLPGRMRNISVARIAAERLDDEKQIISPIVVTAWENTVPRAADGSVWNPPPAPIEKPSWVPDNEVFRCPVQSNRHCQAASGFEFHKFCRRHHCRACGNVCCSSCSKARMELPFSNGKLVRVCGSCVKRMSGVEEIGAV